MVFATEESLERLIANIPSEANREFARTFSERKRANGRKLSTVISQMNHVRAWGEYLGERAFTSATEADVRRFLLQRNIERRWRPKGASEVKRNITIKDSTMELRKIVLRSFQSHVRNIGKRDPLPAEVAWLEAKPRNQDDETPVDANDILTRDELKAMIQSRDHPQEKAILACLYDSGMRASEFCSLKIRSVVIDEHGAVLVLQKGGKKLKTGARRVRVLNCTPYLLAWLNAHPKRDDPEAALWLTLGTFGKGQPLGAGALGRLVHRAADAANIKRRIWTHLFRHSRATECAKEGMREMEMRIHFGWSASSDMPAKYIHLVGADVDEGMLRRAGKSPNLAPPESALRPRACLCGHENAATSDFCEAPGCGRPLTLSAHQKREQAQRELLIDSVAHDPAALARLANVLMLRSTMLGASEATEVPKGHARTRARA